MQRIDCVVFDVGNVLIRWDPRNLYRQMGYSDAATAAILAETRLLDINHRQLDAGAPFAATLAALATRHPQHAAFIQAFDSRWTDMLGGAIPQSVATHAALRRNGMPVCAITNFSREKFDLARRQHPLLEAFDELVVSGDVGLVKPDAGIFELLIARRRLDVGRAAFVDDSAANIATARRLGFATVHFKEGTTDLAAELARLGVPVRALT